MLNKKKVVLIAIVIVLLLVIMTVFMVSGKKSKTIKTYNKLLESNEYSFEVKNTADYDITIAKKGDKMCIDMYSSGERVTTILKDDVAYVISHSQREYGIYNKDIVGAVEILDLLGDLQDKKFSKGKETVNGKTYKYEEYEDFASFIVSTEFDDNKTKTRFYFDKNNLVYIKTIIEEADPELLEVSISYSTPDELFEIPSDYTKNENTGL